MRGGEGGRIKSGAFPLSWPGLSRPSRLWWQGAAFLSEVAGSSPAMTPNMGETCRSPQLLAGLRQCFLLPHFPRSVMAVAGPVPRLVAFHQGGLLGGEIVDRSAQQLG